MKVLLGIIAAAGIAAPTVFSQTPTPPAAPTPPARARAAASVIVQSGVSYLGIGSMDIDAERAKALKLKEERGVEVMSVKEDSPASKAGIQKGDVILEYAGQAVQGTSQLTRIIRETPAGREVKIMVWRNGSTQTLTATIAKSPTTVESGGNWPFTTPMPSMPPMAAPMEMPHFQVFTENPVLGIYGEQLGDEEQLAEYFGVKDGVLVKSVVKNSPAERAGVKAGDVIVKIDDTRVGSTQEVNNALRLVRSKGSYSVTVVRNKKEMQIAVNVKP